MKKIEYILWLALLVMCGTANASVDSDYKERPDERFVVYTGDGHYKQAYHWAFNEDGQGPAITIFLNHGAGGEWYDEIDSEFGPCGPDYLGNGDDFTGSPYQGLCQTDDQGNELYLADFRYDHVPVGPELEEFMVKKIVGSTQFAAWYWQDAFQQFDSPVHVFMVGRYNVVTDPAHLDNTLYWLQMTDENLVSRDTLPPYNFDGYGLSDIDGDDRPLHAAPDIAGFDNMFLYKAVKDQFPQVSLDNLVVEGRSNGGSAMIAMASNYHVWPTHMRDFWSRNLPGEQAQAEPEEVYVPGMTLSQVADNPVLAAAFEAMLSEYTEADLVEAVNNGQNLTLAGDGFALVSSAGLQQVEAAPVQGGGQFYPDTFESDLAALLGGDFYGDVKLVHAFYPGCRLDGFMEQDSGMTQGEVAEDGDNANGYSTAVRMMFSFGDEDSLYKAECDERVQQSQSQTALSGTLMPSSVTDGSVSTVGEVFSPAQHGFDYKDVYKNLPGRTQTEQARANESRRAIERVVNQAIIEIGLQGEYTLPHDID